MQPNLSNIPKTELLPYWLAMNFKNLYPTLSKYNTQFGICSCTLRYSQRLQKAEDLWQQKITLPEISVLLGVKKIW
jgi:hypothetical protein